MESKIHLQTWFYSCLWLYGSFRLFPNLPTVYYLIAYNMQKQRRKACEDFIIYHIGGWGKGIQTLPLVWDKNARLVWYTLYHLGTLPTHLALFIISQAFPQPTVYCKTGEWNGLRINSDYVLCVSCFIINCHISAHTTDQQLTLDIQIGLFPGHMKTRIALRVQINNVKYKCTQVAGDILLQCYIRLFTCTL